MEVLKSMVAKRIVRNLGLLLVIALFSVCDLGYSATYYVAPAGDDSNPGTKEKALGSIEKAIEFAAAGDSILIRGGTYALSKRLNVEKDGSMGKLIKMWAYPGEEAILDFTKASRSSDGLKVDGSYWHIKGLIML